MASGGAAPPAAQASPRRKSFQTPHAGVPDACFCGRWGGRGWADDWSHRHARQHVVRTGAPVGRRGKPVPPPRSQRPARGRDTTSAQRSSCAAQPARPSRCGTGLAPVADHAADSRASRTTCRRAPQDQRRAAGRPRMPGRRTAQPKIGRRDWHPSAQSPRAGDPAETARLPPSAFELPRVSSVVLSRRRKAPRMSD